MGAAVLVCGCPHSTVEASARRHASPASRAAAAAKGSASCPARCCASDRLVHKSAAAPNPSPTHRQLPFHPALGTASSGMQAAARQRVVVPQGATCRPRVQRRARVVAYVAEQSASSSAPPPPAPKVQGLPPGSRIWRLQAARRSSQRRPPPPAPACLWGAGRHWLPRLLAALPHILSTECCPAGGEPAGGAEADEQGEPGRQGCPPTVGSSASRRQLDSCAQTSLLAAHLLVHLTLHRWWRTRARSGR